MTNPVIVVGSYENRLRAEIDYEALAKQARELWDERVYALGLVERTQTGKAKVINHLEPDTNIGTISGAVVGGLVGFLYPPSVVLTAAAGAGVGRAITHLWHGVSRKDVAELGNALDAGEGAVLVLAEKLPEDFSVVLPHASHVVHRTMTHKHEDIEALINELRELHTTEASGAAAAVATDAATASVTDDAGEDASVS
jgi:uncharacterized membrane protein